MRPTSNNNDRRSLRSFQSCGHDLSSHYRPSSSSSRQGSQLHAARSMTSMSQYRDNYPRYTGRSPSPAFYSSHDRYDHPHAYDDDLHYPIEPLQYSSENLPHQRMEDDTETHPRSAGGMAQSMRQTPSPLRWAMQDLMESLDTMSPELRPVSPSTSFHDFHPTYLPHEHPYDQLGPPSQELWDTDDIYQKTLYTQHVDNGVPQYTYPSDMRPPQLLNYVDKMQSRLDRLQNYHTTPQSGDFGPIYEDEERSISRISNRSDLQPRSSYSVDKPLPASPSFFVPKPPPHSSSHKGTGSIASHSTKYSIFSSASTSDYSSATSQASSGSAGSAGQFAKKRLQQLRERQAATEQQTAMNFLPKGSSTNGLLRRKKSYGASLKKTIGKLLNTSPTKPPPGTVTDHGGKIIEWQNARRDVNRANTPSAQERLEQRERLELEEGIDVIRPFEILQQIIEGDESANGSPILPDESFDITSKCPFHA